jgi:hypothetical protein
LSAPQPTPDTMTTSQRPTSHAGDLPLQVGKYLIAPLTQALQNGWFACAVSIRTGAGATFNERLLRITRLFRDPRAASEFALDEALQWIAAPRSAAAA